MSADPRPRRFTNAELDKIVEMSIQDCSASEIADALGRPSRGSIIRIARKLGVPLTGRSGRPLRRFRFADLTALSEEESP